MFRSSSSWEHERGIASTYICYTRRPLEGVERRRARREKSAWIIVSLTRAATTCETRERRQQFSVRSAFTSASYLSPTRSTSSGRSTQYLPRNTRLYREYTCVYASRVQALYVCTRIHEVQPKWQVERRRFLGNKYKCPFSNTIFDSSTVDRWWKSRLTDFFWRNSSNRTDVANFSWLPDRLSHVCRKFEIKWKTKRGKTKIEFAENKRNRERELHTFRNNEASHMFA